MINNFSFLTKDYPKIQILAEHAEQYVFSDPHTALLKMRIFGEQLSKEILKQEGMKDVSSTQKKRIHLLSSQGFINSEIEDMFHILRKEGNVAGHDLYGQQQQALRAIETGYHLAKWYFCQYHKSTNIEPYVIPRRTQDNKTISQLQEHINKLQEKTTQISNRAEPSILENKREIKQLQNEINQLRRKTVQLSSKTEPAITTEEITKLQEQVQQLQNNKIYHEVESDLDKNSRKTERKGKRKRNILISLGIIFLIPLIILFGNIWCFNNLGRIIPTSFENYVLHNKENNSIFYSISNEMMEFAIAEENLNRIKFLLSKGVTPDKEIIRIASVYEDYNLVDQLLQSETDVNQTFLDGASFLNYSIINNDDKLFDKLLENKANVNYRDKNSDTPVFLAIEYERYNMLEKLIEHGADINKKNVTNNQYPIEFAKALNLPSYIELLELNGSPTLLQLMIPNYFGYWKTKDEKYIGELTKKSDNEIKFLTFDGSIDHENILSINNENEIKFTDENSIIVSNLVYIRITSEEYAELRDKLQTQAEEALLEKEKENEIETAVNSYDFNQYYQDNNPYYEDVNQYYQNNHQYNETISNNTVSSNNSNTNVTEKHPEEIRIEKEQALFEKLLSQSVGYWKQEGFDPNISTSKVLFIYGEDGYYRVDVKSNSSHGAELDFADGEIVSKFLTVKNDAIYNREGVILLKVHNKNRVTVSYYSFEDWVTTNFVRCTRNDIPLEILNRYSEHQLP